MKFKRSYLAVALLVVFAVATDSPAQVQDSDQQKCIKSVNKHVTKISKTQQKIMEKCQSAKFKGDLAGTLDDCIAADADGKLAKVVAKTTTLFEKKCATAPDFASTDDATVSTASAGESLALMVDVFGSPLDDAAAGDKDGQTCQKRVLRGLDKIVAAKLKAFNQCKVAALESAADASSIETCVNDMATDSKVVDTIAKLASTFTQKCADLGIDISEAFPGQCSSESNETFAACADVLAECRACLSLVVSDGLGVNCDLFDDAVANASCDAVCGDGTTAGAEQCDDGAANSEAPDASCRTDCTDAGCGDGVVDSAEDCDDGDSNDDATPDACRTDCSDAGCGDGVTDTGEDCDDSGQSAGCDIDCTDVVCGDGTKNAAAGEECDDGAGNSDAAPDACRTSCLDASCGDNVIDSGEECDDGVGNDDAAADACRTTCVAASCGDGVVDTGEECDEEGDGCLGDCTLPECGVTDLCVFVSSSTYTGGISDGPNLGITAADNICNDEAEAAGLPGVGKYRAWLGTSLVSRTERRLWPSGNPSLAMTRVDGLPLLADATTLCNVVANTFTNPVALEADGTDVGPSAPVWTGTFQSCNRTGQDCSNWTDSTNAVRGEIGQPQETDRKWTDDVPIDCDIAHRFYCMQTSL